MEENVREILSKLSTQIDGVEHYLRQLIEIGENGKTKEEWSKLQTLRVGPEVEIDTSIYELRKCVQRIEDALG